MNKPKRHHYVAEMIQRRFADAGGRLYAFRRGGPEVFCTTPGNLFLEGQLYTMVDADGTTDVTLEKNLAELEARTDAWLSVILPQIREGTPPLVTRAEKDDWHLFLYMQMKRVPSIHERGELAGFLDSRLLAIRDHLIQQYPERTSEIDLLTVGQEGARIKKNARIAGISSTSGKVLSALARREIAILCIRPSTRRQFILGDSPVLRLGRGGLDSPDHEIWFPVASDVMLGVGRPGEPMTLRVTEDVSLIRRLNAGIASRSRLIASGSKALTTSLARMR